MPDDDYDREYDDGIVTEDTDFHEPAHPELFDDPMDPWDDDDDRPEPVEEDDEL